MISKVTGEVLGNKVSCFYFKKPKYSFFKSLIHEGAFFNVAASVEHKWLESGFFVVVSVKYLSVEKHSHMLLKQTTAVMFFWRGQHLSAGFVHLTHHRFNKKTAEGRDPDVMARVGFLHQFRRRWRHSGLCGPETFGQIWESLADFFLV